jgi:hypothetical protein
MSMNATLMSHYIQFCANCLLCKLKQPTSYLQCYKQTPSHGWIYYFPLAKKAKQSNFFEKRAEWVKMQKWSQYYKQCEAPHILSWWTVLKHATSSTYLFTYLCYPNLHSRSRTSYMVLIFLAILTARRYPYVMQAL